MKSCKKQNKLISYVSSIFMMLALAWLTVSLPFVYEAQQVREDYKSAAKQDLAGTEEDSNPFSNTTEEKTPNNNNVNTPSEEYLHDHHSSETYIAVPSTEYKVEHASTYIAFHGELISPPPDATVGI
jgi:cytoskeletal protein RodZ